MKSFIFSALAAGLLVGCNTGAGLAVSDVVKVDSTFQSGSFGTNLQSTTIYVAVKVREKSGFVQICAAVTAKGSSTFATEWPDATAKATNVSIAGDRILSGLNFAATYINDDRILGKQANCATTTSVWKPNYNGKQANITFSRISLKA